MCRLCELKPVYEFTNKRTLCKTCFIRWFEKKLFYTIRKFNMINQGDKILCKKENYFRSVALFDALNFYCSKSGNILLTSGKNYNKIALVNNLDLNSFEFIEELRNNSLSNLKKFFPVFGKKIYPLYLFLDKEILLYVELKKLKYKNENFNKIPPIQPLTTHPKNQEIKNYKITKYKNEKNSWVNFINELEKKHPEIKNAIMNSYLKIIA